MTQNSDTNPLRIAYTIQNVGGINLNSDIGDAVPVKYSLRGLQKAGHKVACIRFLNQAVVQMDDMFQFARFSELPTGVAGNPLFRWVERGIRKLQQLTRIPYFAFFDSFRFYNVCRAVLPHYDVCHEHNGLLSIGTALAAKRVGKPYILTFSADPLLEYALLGRPLRGLQRWVAEKEMRYTFREARKILCVSDAAKAHLASRWNILPEKIVVMPNGVDTTLFYPDEKVAAVTRTDLGLDDAPVVGFVGGFQEWHGIDGLVEAFAAVRGRVPGAKLLLVGDGPARPMVDAAVARFGVAADTTITGFVPQSRVPELLAAVDVAVVPYPKLPQELWFSPLKLYEYMAAAKAIVASADGQISQVIQSEITGILFEPGDISAMTTGIIRVLSDAELRESLGQAARAQAITHHSWDEYIRRLEKVYESVM